MAIRNVTSRAMGMVRGPDRKTHAGVGSGDGAEIGAPQEKGQVGEDQVDAEGTKIGDHGRRLYHPVDEHPLDEVTDDADQTIDTGSARNGSMLIEGEHPVGGKGTDHDQLAMEDVDDVHHAEYERETARIRRVDTSHEQARDKGLKEQSHENYFLSFQALAGYITGFSAASLGKPWSAFRPAPGPRSADGPR